MTLEELCSELESELFLPTGEPRRGLRPSRYIRLLVEHGNLLIERNEDEMRLVDEGVPDNELGFPQAFEDGLLERFHACEKRAEEVLRG